MRQAASQTTFSQNFLAGLNLSSPNDDELEICVFGGGFGESILIHFGSGKWCLVDSCIFKGADTSAALDYLRAIKVDPEAVEFVLATHWDDDHVLGLSDVFAATPHAKFIISNAIRDTKFNKIVLDSPLSASVSRGQKSKTGVSEYNRIFKILKSRGMSPVYVGQDTLFYRKDGVEIHALSPHSTAFSKAISSLISLIPSGNSPIARIKAQRPNHTSVTLWVNFNGRPILLGADLEEASDHKGWSLLLSDSVSVGSGAEVYKVAHHGSKTGDHEGVWERLLAPNGTAIIAPWSRGGRFLPTQDDIYRVKSHTSEAHITSPEASTTTVKSDPATLQILKRVKAKSISHTTSFVRLRRNRQSSSAWHCDHFGLAQKL